MKKTNRRSSPSPLPTTKPVAWFTYLWAYLPVVVWAGWIFWLSNSRPLINLATVPSDFVFKKLSHIFVYGVLFWLIYRAISLTNRRPYPQLIYLPLFLTFLYAVSDEFHQSLIPGRFASFRDVAYDMVGAGLIWGIKIDSQRFLRLRRQPAMLRSVIGKVPSFKQN